MESWQANEFSANQGRLSHLELQEMLLKAQVQEQKDKGWVDEQKDSRELKK